MISNMSKTLKTSKILHMSKTLITSKIITQMSKTSTTSKTFIKISKTLKMSKMSKILKIMICMLNMGTLTLEDYVLHKLVDDASSISDMFLQRLSAHWINECRFTDLVITKIKRVGLKIKFIVECRMCHYRSSFWSEPTDDRKLDVNRGIVAGTILTGIGHKQLEELLAAVDVTCMSNKTYISFHNEMSEAFAAAAEEEMRMAGEEERRLAIKRGDVIDGVPHIPVITDGSWMKRSYRSGSYDSPSGAAIITGHYLQKVLFVGVRNKYCVICARAAKLSGENRKNINVLKIGEIINKWKAI
ncbi:uncharacterized protein LOC143897990 [Temnothorax americanus]|uniref:uncharacterized protein LOC143897990 n=1 Tax=Temnothorax americanus TaxID=1964332 RepID=UPI0040686AB1